MPPTDLYELCSRLLYGPGTWFEVCRAAAGDPDATAGLMRRLAPDGDASRALATRNTWPGESRLPRSTGRGPGPARSAALAAADVAAALTRGTDTEDLLRHAATHWRRANVLPALSLTGANIDVNLADPLAAVVARRLAVLADNAPPREAAAYGLVNLLVSALTGAWPRRRREVQLPVLFDRRSTGGHGSLRLTLLDAGPPGLYPDPRAMLFLVADGRFAESLDVAWRTAGAPLAGRCVVWRLTVDDLPCDEVAGGSLGAAFGVALTDLARRTPPAVRVRRLDRRCAITAGLQPDLGLSRVTGLPNKLEEAVRQWLRVILAPPADRETLPEPLLHEARVRFAADLRAAVRQSRTRVNPTFAVMVVTLLLAVAGMAGGLLAAVRESRAAHVRDIAAGLLPAAATLRSADPADALLLEALAVQLDGPGAKAALIRSVLTNRYAGVLAGPDNHEPCHGTQAWSPDSTHVVTVQREATTSQGTVTPRTTVTVRNRVLLWDTRQRTVDRTIEVAGQVSGCALSPDGRTVALAVDDRLVLVPLDRPPSSAQAAPVSNVPVHWVQYAPNGLLATMAEQQPVRLWSVAGPQRPRMRATIAATIARLGESDAPELAFSRDSGTLVFGERNRTVITDISHPDQPRVTSSIPASPSSLALSSQGTLAIGLWGDTELWDIRDRSRPVRTRTLPAQSQIKLPIGSVAFTPDGLRLVVADGTSQIWQLDGSGAGAHRTLAPTRHQVTSADLSPDGDTALVYDASGTSALWRLADQEERPALATLPLGPARITGVAVQPGTTRLVVTAAAEAATVWDIGDPANPRRIHTVGPRDGQGAPYPEDGTLPTAFATDGRRYAADDGDGGVGVWAVGPDGRIRRTGAIHRIGEQGVAPLALSPDGTLLAARPFESTRPFELTRPVPVSLWDVRDRPRLIGQLPATAGTRDVAFAPDGRTLVTVTTAGSASVTWWNVTDPAHPRRLASRGFPAARDGTPGPIVFTPDGRRMFVTSGTGPGAVWETSNPASPVLLTTVRAVSGADSHHAVLRGPAMVLSAPGAVDVWDVANPQEASQAAALVSGDDNAFFFGYFAVTQEGLLATTQLADGTASIYTGEAVVRLRDLRPILDAIADPVTAACRIAGHDLSPQIWRRYAPGVQVRPICRR